MENRCIIVSGGVFSPAPEQQPGDFVIACDRATPTVNGSV